MAKNIVVCYDGTGNEFCKNNTNVVKTFQAALRENERQVAFYDPGVGTFSVLGRVVGRRFGILVGKAFGWGLQENLEDGYRYLMAQYRPGDRIYLFGFSRGAFQARALAGMLYRCGILQQGAENLVHYVSGIYNRYRTEGVGPDVTEAFKATYCHPCPVHFIGVWDTVGSLGWLYGKRFFDAALNDQVSFGYHAMAIDEKRKKFPVLPWNESPGALKPHQTVEQVWFAGVHSDVGGWYDEHGMSDIALEWMLRKAEACDLLLKPDWQRQIQPEHAANPTDPIHESRTGFWKLWPPAPRVIPEGAKVHRSVQLRMNGGCGYKPANLPQSITWVD